MSRLGDASAASLVPFVEESVEPGSLLHTDGWMGYEPLEKKGYRHRIVFLSGTEGTEAGLGVAAASSQSYLAAQALDAN
jgi:ISXO2-like transposase domain